MTEVAGAATRRPLATRRGRPRGSVGGAPRRSVMGFLAPFVTLFALFYLVPIGYALYRSFFVTEREGPFGAPQEVFGGLQNYTRALEDSEFVRSVGRMLLFGIVQVPVMLLLALTFALLLDSAVVRLKRFFRLTYFLPYAVPGVIGAIMWGFLYVPGLSPIVDIIRDLGVGLNFLSGDTVLWSIANIVTWKYTGYNMLIIYSALQAVPAELYEAARIDGASGWDIALADQDPADPAGADPDRGLLHHRHAAAVHRAAGAAQPDDVDLQHLHAEPRWPIPRRRRTTTRMRPRCRSCSPSPQACCRSRS